MGSGFTELGSGGMNYYLNIARDLSCIERCGTTSRGLQMESIAKCMHLDHRGKMATQVLAEAGGKSIGRELPQGRWLRTKVR